MPRAWLDGYDFFNPVLFDAAEQWRAQQVVSWIAQYAHNHFQDLEIWHVDWQQLGACLMTQ